MVVWRMRMVVMGSALGKVVGVLVVSVSRVVGVERVVVEEEGVQRVLGFWVAEVVAWIRENVFRWPMGG